MIRNSGHMTGMTDTPTPPLPATGSSSPAIKDTGPNHHPTMHMAFFWSRHGEILFPGWPGSNSGMYALVLLFIFFLAILVEYLSHSNFARKWSGPVAVGLVQTVVHALRAGLVYMVMLAVMSFNGGVFVVAVVGHAVGFLVFGSCVFRKVPVTTTDFAGDKSSDLAPMISV